jgi:hypothetical protein
MKEMDPKEWYATNEVVNPPETIESLKYRIQCLGKDQCIAENHIRELRKQVQDLLWWKGLFLWFVLFYFVLEGIKYEARVRYGTNHSASIR